MSPFKRNSTCEEYRFIPRSYGWLTKSIHPEGDPEECGFAKIEVQVPAKDHSKDWYTVCTLIAKLLRERDCPNDDREHRGEIESHLVLMNEGTGCLIPECYYMKTLRHAVYTLIDECSRRLSTSKTTPLEGEARDICMSFMRNEMWISPAIKDFIAKNVVLALHPDTGYFTLLEAWDRFLKEFTITSTDGVRAINQQQFYREFEQAMLSTYGVRCQLLDTKPNKLSGYRTLVLTNYKDHKNA